jgi:alpha-tubulin suppressor-like RCC1 family protein
VTAVAAGGLHTCAIRTDGAAACWGSNAAGQRTVPPGLGAVIAITAGDRHTCALRVDGTPDCWGDDGSGQSTIPPGLGTVIAISAGANHTCAVETGGAARCWGADGSEQSTIPPGLGTVRAISAGAGHSCAIRTDGTATCWGDDTSGQSTIPPDLGSVRAISAGGNHTCAIETGGTATCWGADASGQSTVPAGLGSVTTPPVTAGQSHACGITADGTPVCWGRDTSGQSTVPAGLETVIAISAGRAHTCAIETDGTAACWGADGAGQSTVPPGLGTVRAISASDDHTCAIETAGTAACWGSNSLGESAVPAGLGTVKAIATGAGHTCAVKTNGHPECWGWNFYGQSTVPPEVTTVTALTAGFAHTCAIETDGQAACWGDDEYGQSTVPAGLGTVRAISAGGQHTCAIKTDGHVACWGLDNVNQSTVPRGVGTASAIELGSGSTCAVSTGRRATCWGSEGGLPLPLVPPDEILLGSPVQHHFNSPRPAHLNVPATFTMTGGTLPPGLTLSGDLLSGTPTAVGVFAFTIKQDNGVLEPRLKLFSLEIIPFTRAGGWSAPAPVKGDFNQDGFGDLALAVPGEDFGPTTDAGLVHVLYGSASGLSATGSQVWSQRSLGVIDAPESGDRFGAALAVGDLDGDGRADLAVGVPGENGGAGAVHVLYGSPAGLSADGSQYWSQASPRIADDAEPGDHFGASLAIGDLGNGAQADLAVGVPDEGPAGAGAAGVGAVHVIYGSATGLSATSSQLWSQATPALQGGEPARNEHFGAALAIGDVGKDAQGDLAIGVPGDLFARGGVHVLYGQAAGLSVTGNMYRTQDSIGIADFEENGDRFGAALAIADLGGSAHGDVAVGVPGENQATGAAHVILGGATGLTSQGSQFWTQGTGGVESPEPDDYFGAALAAGDLGHSGDADLAIGAPGEDLGTTRADAGAVTVVYGIADSLSEAGMQLWTQNTAGIADAAEVGDHFGASLSAAAHGNGATHDLAVGAPYEDVGLRPEAGAAHVLYGSALGLSATGSQLWTQNSAGIADAAESGDGFGGGLGR